VPARGARVLVVDDEAAIVLVLNRTLAAQGYVVTVATTGSEALAAIAERPPDVILLDLGLPDVDGLEVVRRVRERGATPIIVLSARHTEAAKVEALTLGADDYVEKPFGMNELLARIQVALRHAAGPGAGAEPVFRAGDLAVDVGRRVVTRGGEEVRLTPTEYERLKALATHSDKVLTHRTLLNLVWGGEQGTDAHYLHVYMGQLRRKIERDPSHPRHLVAEPGVGYRFRTA
jgi:two-component system KDP operon response regulator KdpE